MEKLPPIPTPASAQWREFRYQYLPAITFLAVVIAVVIMWRNYVVPPTVLAEVEPMTANVISTQAGILTTLKVERFQRVTNGQEIGQIVILEPNILTASLGAIQADLNVMRSRMEVDQFRASQAYEEQRLVFLQERVQNNISKVLLARYTADFLRVSNLWLATKPPLVSEQQYDLAKELYDRTSVQVTQTEEVLKEKEKALPKLQADSTKLLGAIEQAIKAQEEKLRAENQNLILRAPIDGTVSALGNQPGERVVPGKPIVVITPHRSDRIIAYVRQPMNMVPTNNAPVMIRRQTFKREWGYGKVVQVGSQMERIDPALLPGGVKVIDMGLPFLVKVDKTPGRPDLDLAPGERVDVIVNPRNKPEAN